MTVVPPPPAPSPERHREPFPERHLERLAWPAVQAAAKREGSTVLWALGSLEQHGPHLPLQTDALFADRLVEALIETLPAELPLWRLPVQMIGFAPEHRGFAGSFSLAAGELIALVRVVGEELARCGFRRLVLMNGHGGQIGLLEVAARDLRTSVPALAVLPCFLWRGLDDGSSLIPEPERSQGLHAGLAETSLMLHLAPELVGPERPADGLDLRDAPPPGWSWEGGAPTAWRTGELSASGVIGDSSGATAELGEKLFAGLVNGWDQRLRSLLSHDWPPTTFKP
ncbi:MAG: creatininase family protein [Cyanobacteriota bacterium]|nr:creatininase family protein [Cyanobacteriota bacterium]